MDFVVLCGFFVWFLFVYFLVLWWVFCCWVGFVVFFFLGIAGGYILFIELKKRRNSELSVELAFKSIEENPKFSVFSVIHCFN